MIEKFWKNIIPVEIWAVIVSFAIITWAIIGEYFWGVYGWYKFLPLYIIPMFQLLRIYGLDQDALQEKRNHSVGLLNKIFPILVLIFTFAAIPYYCALFGAYPQNVFIIKTIFSGQLPHIGIHHGFLGWLFILEAYFFHRLNRYAVKKQNIGKVWRNFLLVFGIYMFFNDYWAEQFTAGSLHWFDPFKYVEHLMPFSWDTDFAIELIVVIMIFFICELVYFIFHKQQIKKILLSPILDDFKDKHSELESLDSVGSEKSKF